MKRPFQFFLLLVSCLATTTASAQFQGMRNRIPGDANTLVLINAEKVFGSAIAERQRWQERRQAAYEAGIMALPPDATEVILAGRTDIEFGEPIWELALIHFAKQANLASVATRFGGTMDEIRGRSAARLPNDQYIVQITPTLLGSHRPANRQDVSRWLASTDVISAEDGLSPYLFQAFNYAAKVGSPIILAMDLHDAISPAMIQRGLGQFESISGASVSVGQLTEVLEQVQGITLGVTLKDQAVGAIRVDFDQSPQMLAEVGKPLLIEILEHNGAMIEDIRDWRSEVTGNTLMLRGTLSETGLRKIMSLLELPRELADAMRSEAASGSDPEQTAKLMASQQYWISINTLLDDLSKKPKRDHVQSFGQAAMWCDRYARRIDNLPLLNVDEELVDYGASVASALRDAELAMKGVGMRTGVRTANNNPASGGYYATMGGYRSNYVGPGYGPTGVTVGIGPGRASVREKSRTDAVIRQQERTAGAASVQQIFQQIEQSRAEIRRKMVKKYGAEF
ncbi:hypothetical protein [Roseimaritima sediminicola]|uniref:hypothetical protein n=1 Tax=Roseimaritima sediminicola TaxID=2662066 RepID=UPI0012982D65|nr:hypothetical protein [Roseimaritima sediminicola]